MAIQQSDARTAAIHQDKTPDAGLGFMEAMNGVGDGFAQMKASAEEAYTLAAFQSKCVFNKHVEKGEFPAEKDIIKGGVEALALAQRRGFSNETAEEADRRFAEMAEGNGKKHTDDPGVDIIPPPEKKVAA